MPGEGKLHDSSGPALSSGAHVAHLLVDSSWLEGSVLQLFVALGSHAVLLTSAAFALSTVQER